MKSNSYNCTGFKYRNYDYIQRLFTATDDLLIQETWLYGFEDSRIKMILWAVNTMPRLPLMRMTWVASGGCT